MVDVRVDAAVRDEPQEMHVSPPLLRSTEGADQSVILEEGAVRDRIVDPDEILRHDPPRSDRQVADLGVPHLSLREADGAAGRSQRRVWVAGPQGVETRGCGELDRVPRPRRRAPPAVEDDERYERIRLAVSQIAAKESTSSEAPPTRAPSTSG